MRLRVLAALLLLAAPAAHAAPVLLEAEFDAPGWVAWRVRVPPQSSVAFTTSIEGGLGLRAEGGAVLGRIGYASLAHSPLAGPHVAVAGAAVLDGATRGGLPDDARRTTLACPSMCLGGEMVLVRYATGDVRHARLGIELDGATLVSTARGEGGIAAASTRAMLRHEHVAGVLVGAFVSPDGATLRAAGPGGVRSCDCHFLDEAPPGEHAFAAWGPQPAFLVGVDARLPP